jgi:transposase-like protein
MRTETKYHRQPLKHLTKEQKRDYCLQWERSGQSKAAFCQSVGIAKSAFYSWCHQFKQEAPSDTVFSPVTLKASPTIASENVMQLEICLPNQTKVFIPMQKSNVVSFIQELCHAATVIR